MELVVVEGVVKRYGTRAALDGVDLRVQAGEIVGLLGPNGAGKSTTLSILATLLTADAGRVTVGGHALPAGARAVRRLLGLVPQRLALYPSLTADENLRFFGRMLGLDRAAARAASADALRAAGLDTRADEPIQRFSVGMCRRLNLAAGLLHRPRVVLLDEPTVGVDPQSRERIFEAVTALAAAGAAVLYSTHYMEEAARLCGRVVLLDGGRVVASGTPAELVRTSGLRPRLELRLGGALPTGWLAGVHGAREVERRDGHVAVLVDDGGQVAELLRLAGPADVRDVALHRPDLADVFFARTGRALRDEAEHS
jgi:ABC-2 type transport system ATP-binding protein